MVQLRIYTSLRKEIRRLSYEEKGMLLDAMLAYAEDKSLLPLSGKADVIWDIIQERIDAQHEAYDQRCAVNKQNITKRYESYPKSTNRYESKEVNLTLNTSTNTNTNINQVTKVKKRKKRDFEERSVTDMDFKDLFLDLNKGGENDKSNGENC